MIRNHQCQQLFGLESKNWANKTWDQIIVYTKFEVDLVISFPGSELKPPISAILVIFNHQNWANFNPKLNDFWIFTQ